MIENYIILKCKNLLQFIINTKGVFIMDCRGKQMREQIVQMYDLELIIYYVLSVIKL